MDSPLHFSDIDTNQPLPTTINLTRKSSDMFLALVVKNKGELVARFVKIHLELINMGEGTLSPGIKFKKTEGSQNFLIRDLMGEILCSGEVLIG